MTRRIISKFCTDLPHVKKSSVFRYSLVATLIASVITSVAMLMTYQQARQEISSQVDNRLIAEARRIRQQYEQRSAFSLNNPLIGITERSNNESNIAYCVSNQANGYEQTENDNFFSTVNHAGTVENYHLYTSHFNDLCQPNLSQEFAGNMPDLLPIIDWHINQDMMRVAITPLSDQFTLIAGYDTKNERRILRRMFSTVIYSSLLLIAASFFGSFYISRSITRNTKRISDSARRIVDGDFGERIIISPNDSNEMRDLAKNLNHMLERLDALISSQRQVTNNIAHDMRSPLNRLRSRMEVCLLDRNRSSAELRDVIGESVEDINKLLQTFNAMLTIAQIEARARDDFKATDLSLICEELSELYEIFAEEEGSQHFSSTIAPNLSIFGNRQLIAQAITNLLDNAVKYTPSGGNIHLQAYEKNRHIHIAVSDNGPGIPADDRERVLQRFVRLDNSRSTPGNGLGLSMVAAATHLHDGNIQLSDNNPGLKIELIIPNAATFCKKHQICGSKDKKDK